MELIIMILIGIVIFMFSVYFTRWVFGIDKIIENQKNQIELLTKISEIMQLVEEKQKDKTNVSITDKTNLTNNKVINYCPACNNLVKEYEKECSDCGLVIN